MADSNFSKRILKRKIESDAEQPDVVYISHTVSKLHKQECLADNAHDDDVIFIPHDISSVDAVASTSTASSSTASGSTRSTNLKHEENNNLKEEQDLYITYCKEPITCNFPHLRANCPRYKFLVTFNFFEDPSEQNKEHCDFCYCFVCDIEASKCKNWTATNAHCNAFDNVTYWKTERETCKKTIFYKVPLGEQTPKLQQTAQYACSAVSRLKSKFDIFRKGNVVHRTCNCQCHYQFTLLSREQGCDGCQFFHTPGPKIYKFSIVLKAMSMYVMDTHEYFDFHKPESGVLLLDAITVAFLSENFQTGGLWTHLNISFVEEVIGKLAKCWERCLNSQDLPQVFKGLAAKRLKHAIGDCNYGNKKLQKLSSLADSAVVNTLVMEGEMDRSEILEDSIIIDTEAEANHMFQELQRVSPQSALWYAAVVQVPQSEVGPHVPLLKVSAIASLVTRTLIELGKLETAAVFLQLPRRVQVPRDFFLKSGQELRDLVKTLITQCSHDDYNNRHFSCLQRIDLANILKLVTEEWKVNSYKVDHVFVYWTRLLLLMSTKYKTAEFLKGIILNYLPSDEKYSRIEEITENQTPLMKWIIKIKKEQCLEFDVPQLTMEGEVLILNTLICISLASFPKADCNIFLSMQSAFDVKKHYLASTALVKSMLEHGVCGLLHIKHFLMMTLTYLDFEALPVSMCDKLLEMADDSMYYIHLIKFCKQQSDKIGESGDQTTTAKINGIIRMMLKRLRHNKVLTVDTKEVIQEIKKKFPQVFK